MKKFALRASLATLGLLAANSASAQIIHVMLYKAYVDPANGVPCVVEIPIAAEKKAHFNAGETITWNFEGNPPAQANAQPPNKPCTGPGGSPVGLMKLKFGKNSRLIPGINGKTCVAVPTAPTQCQIQGMIANTQTDAPSMSRHPYGILYNNDDAGDPEIDIDNGGGAPPPHGKAKK